MRSTFLYIFLLLGLISCFKEASTDVDPETVATNPDWTTASHSKEGELNYDIVFPQSKVNTLEITLGKTNWESIKTDMAAQGYGSFGVSGGGGGGGGTTFGGEPSYVKATLTFNGKKWENAGFRLKGNSTLSSGWKAGIYKLPFRLNMDRFEDEHPEIKNQRMYGFKELSFSSGAKDNSLIREKVTADIFRMAGIPSAQTAFCKVYIDFGDGLKYCGVYTTVEIIDDTMLKTQYGEESGNIYKPESNFSSFTEAAFEKKNNTDTPDFTDVKTIISSLTATNRTTSAAAWRAKLEETMNMDQYIKWLAVNTTLVNWDTYGGMAHNHYLYNHSSKKMLWIPWDNNEALTSQARVNLNLLNVATTWPLIKYVADDAVYYAKYKTYVKEFNDNVFTTSKMNTIFDNATTMITPFVNGSEKEVSPYTNLTNLTSFTAALPILKTHVVSRNTAVKSFVP